jgi:hypothetical protein
MIFPSKIRGLRNRMQPANGRKPKVTEGKLRSGVIWQRTVKQKCLKETGVQCLRLWQDGKYTYCAAPCGSLSRRKQHK